MKTKEFTERLNELGFLVEKNGDHMVVMDFDGMAVLTVYNNVICSIDTVFNTFDELDESDKIKLLKIGTEYAMVPPEYREEEKKYWIKIKKITEGENYLNKHLEHSELFFSDQKKRYGYKTQFTKKEIKEHGLQEFTDSELFELVEVK